MKPGHYDFTIKQGTAFIESLTWKDESATLIDLTGYSAKMQIRKETRSGTVLLELSTANGRISLGGAQGTIDLYVSATDTANITWEEAVYDLLLTPPDGKTVMLLEGTVIAEESVTR